MDTISEAITSTIPLPRYIKQKIKMLQDDFKIKLSFKELETLKACVSEMQVDRVAHDIFMRQP